MLNKKGFTSVVQPVIQLSQGFTHELDCGKWYLKWYVNKMNFIHMFGNKTIWRSSEPIDLISNKIDSEKFLNDFYKISKEFCHIPELYNFIIANMQGILNNTVINSSDYNIIPSGSKFSKALKYFIKDKSLLHAAQDLVSRYIQMSHLHGYLYFSVDPRDYLSASDNANNWTTCHGLQHVYRAGNLSYMLDDCTIVCYLADKIPKTINGFPYKWFSKKWRMYIHLNDNIIYYGNQYPIFNKNYLNKIFNNSPFKDKYSLPELKIFNYIKTDNIEITSSDLYFNFLTNLFPLEDVIKRYLYSLNFNDLLDSSVYIPYTSISLNIDLHSSLEIQKKNITIHPGASVECPSCGNTLKFTNNIICEDCISKYYNDIYPTPTTCNKCGRIISSQQKDYLCDKCKGEINNGKG